MLLADDSWIALLSTFYCIWNMEIVIRSLGKHNTHTQYIKIAVEVKEVLFALAPIKYQVSSRQLENSIQKFDAKLHTAFAKIVTISN